MIKLSLFSARIINGMIVLSLLSYLMLGSVAIDFEQRNSDIALNSNLSDSFFTIDNIANLDQNEIGEQQETESGQIEKFELFSLAASLYAPLGSLHKLYSIHTFSWLNRVLEPDRRPPRITFFT